MSLLGAFNTQLIRFFEDLTDTIPEEKAIRQALEALHGAKKINPKLILDLFYEHVYLGIYQGILNQDEKTVIEFAKDKIQNQFNEISAALIIFDKYWDTLSDSNHAHIWDYLKVLCVLCEKARGITPLAKNLARTE
jgi:hypothetical protein